MKKRAIAVAVVAALSLSAWGEVAIQFDFGTTAGSYSGRIAPAYEASGTEMNRGDTTLITNTGGLGLLDSKDGTVWNASNSGLYSSLKYVDDAPATGVTAAFGVSSGPETVLTWNTGASVWSTTSSVKGVQNTALIEDYLYTTNSVLGFRVTGLPVGTYAVIVMDVVPGYETTRSHEFKAGVFGLASQNDFHDPALLALGTLGVNAKLDATQWKAGDNYLMTTVTTTSTSDYIVVMCSGFNPSMNAIQIIQVPEPATMTLLALGGLAMLRRRREA